MPDRSMPPDEANGLDCLVVQPQPIPAPPIVPAAVGDPGEARPGPDPTAATLMLIALLRRLWPREPAVFPRPLVHTNEAEGPGRGDAVPFYAACPLLDVEPEDGFPVIFVRGRRAL